MDMGTCFRVLMSFGYGYMSPQTIETQTDLCCALCYYAAGAQHWCLAELQTERRWGKFAMHKEETEKRLPAEVI